VQFAKCLISLSANSSTAQRPNRVKAMYVGDLEITVWFTNLHHRCAGRSASSCQVFETRLELFDIIGGCIQKQKSPAICGA
jgi:hypothetical protein